MRVYSPGGANPAPRPDPAPYRVRAAHFVAQPDSGGSGPIALLTSRLIDGASDAPRRDMAIIVESGRIVKIVPNSQVAAAVERIDLRSMTVLPGLIDAHTHPLIGADDYQIDRLKHSSAYKTLRGLRRVQDALQAGWTSIRIAGDADAAYGALDLAKAISDSLVRNGLRDRTQPR